MAAAACELRHLGIEACARARRHREHAVHMAPAQILPALAAHQDELVGVVVESTTGTWPVNGPMDAGYQVHLAHIAAIKRYERPMPPISHSRYA
ncbi:hypothetical protein ACU4GD_14960 [Cupriavidus basilensis]